MLDFANKVVIVTGGNKGLGKAVALGFAKAGGAVAIWGRNHDDNQAVAQEIIDGGGKAVPIKVDVTSEEDVEAAVGTTLESFGGRIDVLVNNAGIMTKGMIDKLPVQEWRKVIEVNMTGAFICSQKVLPIMKGQRSGRIINISSITGKKIHYEAAAHYVASKAGLHGFTRHLAFEGGAFGITVNAVCVGSTNNAMEGFKITPEGQAKRIKDIPMGRLCTGEDVFNAIAFLASDLAEMITAQAIDVDGGQLISWYDYETYARLASQ